MAAHSTLRSGTRPLQQYKAQPAASPDPQHIKSQRQTTFLSIQCQHHQPVASTIQISSGEVGAAILGLRRFRRQLPPSPPWYRDAVVAAAALSQAPRLRPRRVVAWTLWPAPCGNGAGRRRGAAAHIPQSSTRESGGPRLRDGRLAPALLPCCPAALLPCYPAAGGPLLRDARPGRGRGGS